MEIAPAARALLELGIQRGPAAGTERLRRGCRALRRAIAGRPMREVLDHALSGRLAFEGVPPAGEAGAVVAELEGTDAGMVVVAQAQPLAVLPVPPHGLSGRPGEEPAVGHDHHPLGKPEPLVQIERHPGEDGFLPQQEGLQLAAPLGGQRTVEQRMLLAGNGIGHRRWRSCEKPWTQGWGRDCAPWRQLR